MPQAAAIFDVDRTLMDGMSGALFTKHLWMQGMLPLKNKIRIAATVAGYRANLIHETKLVTIGVTCYAGLKIEVLQRAAADCVQKELKRRIFTEAKDTIQKHNKQGDLTILASGSSDLIVAALAKFVKAGSYAATSAIIKNGISTIRVRTPLCYNESKLELVDAILKEYGILWENCHLYSDNQVDLPLFKKVGYKHAVNPDSKLRVTANRENWQILDWKTPADPGFVVSGTFWPVKEKARR